MIKFTEQQIAFVLDLKENKTNRHGDPLTYAEMAEKFQKKFKEPKSPDAIRKAYNRYKNYFDEHAQDNHIRTLKQVARTKKSNSYTSKENRLILEKWNQRDDILESIKETVSAQKVKKIKLGKKPKKSKTKKNATAELLFSDVHYGKLVEKGGEVVVDHLTIRERVRILAKNTVREIEHEGKFFNVEKLIIAMIGDIIENADFHGVESHKGSEFGTSKQIQIAIESVFNDLLLPIAATGIDIEIPCVTGNHDRNGKDKTYSNPGEENFTYIIYKTLQMMCGLYGLKNVTFRITEGLYISQDVYGNTIVYEHGDELKNTNKDTCYNLMAKRGVQLGKVVDFYRFGHWHEVVQYGQGRVICNGSVPGQDSYADCKGFNSEAIQVLNFYVETDKRSTCFYKTFPVYLETKQ